MGEVISEDGSAADSGLASSDDLDEKDRFALLSEEVVLAVEDAKAQLAVVRNASPETAEAEMKEAEKNVAEAKRLFEQMRTELRNLSPEDRAEWLPAAKEHQQAIRDLIAEAGEVNELVAAGGAGAAGEVPMEEDDEPVTVSEGSDPDDSGPSSNEHSVATGNHEFDSSIAAIYAALDRVEAALEDGTVDHSTEGHLQEAENEYNYVKEIVRQLPAGDRAEYMPHAREVRDRLQAAMRDVKAAEDARQVTERSAPIEHADYDDDADHEVDNDDDGIDEEHGVDDDDDDDEADEDVSSQNYDPSVETRLRHYTTSLSQEVKKADAMLDAGDVAGAQQLAKQQEEVYDTFEDEVFQVNADTRGVWAPELRARRAELVKLQSKIALAEKEMPGSGPALEDRLNSLPDAGETEKTKIESLVDELEEQVNELKVPLEEQARGANLSREEVQTLGKQLERAKGTYDELKEAVRSLSPEEKEHWLPSVKTLQKDLQQSIIGFREMVAQQRSGQGEDGAKAEDVDEKAAVSMQATYNALKQAKGDVATAKTSRDAADFTNATNRLNDVEDSLESSLALVANMSEARQQQFSDQLQRMLAEHSTLCQELEAIRDGGEEGVVNDEEDRSAAVPLKQASQGGLEDDQLEDLTDNAADDDDDEGSGAQAMAVAGAATGLDPVVQGKLEGLESNLGAELNKLETGLENLRANFTGEQHAATVQTLARSRELYDEYKNLVRAIPEESKDPYMTKARAYQGRIKMAMGEIDETEQEQAEDEVESVNDSDAVVSSGAPSVAGSDSKRKKEKVSCCTCS